MTRRRKRLLQICIKDEKKPCTSCSNAKKNITADLIPVSSQSSPIIYTVVKNRIKQRKKFEAWNWQKHAVREDLITLNKFLSPGPHKLYPTVLKKYLPVMVWVNYHLLEMLENRLNARWLEEDKPYPSTSKRGKKKPFNIRQYSVWN